MQFFDRYFFVRGCAVLFFACLVLSTGCTPKKSESGSRDTVSVHSEPQKINPFQDERVLVIFGHAYENSELYLDSVQKIFSLQNEAESFEVLQYSHMTKNVAGIRVKMILEKIEEQQSTVVVAIGVPDTAGRYFIQAKKKFPQIKIIALLPMDDTLALEASCLAVVDFTPGSAVLADAQDFFVDEKEAQSLFLAAFFMLSKEDVLNRRDVFLPAVLGESFEQAIQELGYSNLKSAYTVFPYVDPQSNIASHTYILLKKEQSVTGEGT